MPQVAAGTRAHLVRTERHIRSVVAGQPFTDFLSLLQRLSDNEPPYWADLFTSVALQGRMVHQEPLVAARELDQVRIADNFVVAQETVRNSLRIAELRTARPLVSQPP